MGRNVHRVLHDCNVHKCFHGPLQEELRDGSENESMVDRRDEAFSLKGVTSLNTEISTRGSVCQPKLPKAPSCDVEKKHTLHTGANCSVSYVDYSALSNTRSVQPNNDPTKRIPYAYKLPWRNHYSELYREQSFEVNNPSYYENKTSLKRTGSQNKKGLKKYRQKRTLEMNNTQSSQRNGDIAASSSTDDTSVLSDPIDPEKLSSIDQLFTRQQPSLASIGTDNLSPAAPIMAPKKCSIFNQQFNQQFMRQRPSLASRRTDNSSLAAQFASRHQHVARQPPTFLSKSTGNNSFASHPRDSEGLLSIHQHINEIQDRPSISVQVNVSCNGPNSSHDYGTNHRTNMTKEKQKQLDAELAENLQMYEIEDEDQSWSPRNSFQHHNVDDHQMKADEQLAEEIQLQEIMAYSSSTPRREAAERYNRRDPVRGRSVTQTIQRLLQGRQPQSPESPNYSHQACPRDWYAPADLDLDDFEAVLALTEMVGDVRGSHQGSLPNFLVQPQHLSKGSLDDCKICWDDFELGQKVSSLPCAHVFHTKCINRWLEEKSTCPLCREVV